MSDEQRNTLADLHYPLESKSTSEGNWSQWSSLSMIELSALDTYHFVRKMIPHSGQKILEVGSGNGYLSLELARDGHDVVGLDTSQEIIEVAKRTKNAHSMPSGFGSLTYICADIGTWEAAEHSFDIVIITRTLHHLHPLQPILTKVKHLLTEKGRIICQDYAYDRLNEQTMSWMYSMQRLLFLGGLSEEDPATASSDVASIEALQKAWFQKSNGRLNRYEEILSVFQTTFHEQFFSWVPYLFVYIGNEIRHATPEKERSLLTFLRNMEQYLTEKGAIQAVGFRYVGSVREQEIE